MSVAASVCGATDDAVDGDSSHFLADGVRVVQLIAVRMSRSDPGTTPPPPLCPSVTLPPQLHPPAELLPPERKMYLGIGEILASV